VAQTDYILRLIEQFSMMLAELRRKVLGGRLGGDALGQALDQTLEQVGLDLGLALSASPDTLVLMVAPTGAVDVARCWVMAESLYVYGIERQAATDSVSAEAALRRARALYTALAPEMAFTGIDEAVERIDDIDRRTAALSGDQPADTEGDGAT
jgi:hypothetical protein